MSLQQSKIVRSCFFFATALLSSYILSSTIGSATAIYLWLVPTRIGCAVVLTLLPTSKIGMSRPYCSAASLALVITSYASPPSKAGIDLAIIASCLIIGVCLDSLAIAYSPASSWLRQSITIIFARTLGLSLGIFLHPILINHLVASNKVEIFACTTLLALFVLIKETKGDSKPYQAPVDNAPTIALLIDCLRACTRSKTLKNYAPILILSIAASSATTTFYYPLAILTSANLAALLIRPVFFSIGLALAVVLLFLTKTSKQDQLELTTLTALAISLSIASFAPQNNAANMIASSLSLLACLFAYRNALIKTSKIPIYFRTTLPLTLWSVGAVVGQKIAVGNPYLLYSIRLTCLVLIVYSLVRLYKTQKAKAKKVGLPAYTSLASKEQSGPGRHGDSIQDFVNVPLPEPPKKYHLLRNIWQLISVRIPVFFLLIIVLAAFLAGSWQVLDDQKMWKRKTIDNWKLVQTKLFLTSLRRRLEEEMLASKRIPTDWEHFVETTFETPTSQLKAKDFWDTPLTFQILEKEVVITSAGPDKKFSTSDDLEARALRPQGAY